MGKVTIHEVLINEDSKNETMSCIVLLSSGEKLKKNKKKNVKIWHRLFCAQDKDSLIEQVGKYSKWADTFYRNGKIVSSKSLQEKINKIEPIKDTFYSAFYLLPDYKTISEKDVDRVGNILKKYNDEGKMFSIIEMTQIKTRLSDELREEFGDFSGVIEKFIWHKTITYDEKLQKKECFD